MDFPFGETVVRQRGVPVIDPYSGEQTGINWPDPNPNPLPMERCAVYPGATNEPLLDARVPVDSDFTVLAPSGSDVTSADRLVIRGLVCEVNGRPFEWVNPLSGTDFGLAVGAKIREG